jgi:hypothetical protein
MMKANRVQVRFVERMIRWGQHDKSVPAALCQIDASEGSVPNVNFWHVSAVVPAHYKDRLAGRRE